MNIDRLASVTSARLVALTSAETIRAAAAAFANPAIGLLVVCDEQGRAVGVVSKSDLVRHISADGTGDTALGETMSRDIVHCSPNDDLHRTWEVMSAGNLQNVPVLGADRRPLGVLDIRDALRELLAQEEFEDRALVNYIAGNGYQ